MLGFDLNMLGVVAALGSAASWALGSILFKRLGDHFASSAMTLSKEILSAAFLAVALFFVGFEPLELEPLLWLIGSGLLGIALGDTFFFEALRYIGPVASVFLMTLGQVLTVVLAVVFLGERPSLMAWAGIVIVLGGVFIVVRASAGADNRASTTRGMVFGAGAILCMSISSVALKEGVGAVSAMEATFIRMISGAAGMLAFGMAKGRLREWVAPVRDTRLARRFLTAVCVVTFGGFWLSHVSVKYLSLSVANTLNSCEPLFILPMAAFLLGEKIKMSALAGAIGTLLGIVLLSVA